VNTMATIALIGPYDPEIREAIHRAVPSGFLLTEILAESEYDRLHDVNYIILRMLTLNENVINSVPNLKLIQRWGAGYDKVDVKAAGKRNIPVAITSGMNSPSVSDMAVLLMLAVYRQLPLLHSNVVSGKWRGEEGITSTSYVLDDKMVGLIGLGNIGKLVARKVRAFGASVQYYDVVRLTPQEEEKQGVSYVGLEELLKTSDIISLHVPLTDANRHLIRQETIALMKPSAVIINTARGPIIREADLVQALRDRRILGAGLDCLEKEPPENDNPLFGLGNVVLTPHMGGSTMDVNTIMIKRCMENIVKVSRGQLPPKGDFVNAQHFSKPPVSS
jgi:D-3-phosphoglycerate dehydrogenase